MAPRSRIPKVGQEPFLALGGLSPELRDNYIQHISTVMNRGMLGTRNPLWNDEIEISIARELSFTAGPPGNTIMPQVNDRFSKLHPVSDLNLPRDPITIMQTALRYALENPFVAKALRVKVDFAIKSMRHQTMNTTVKDFYDEESVRLSLPMITREILWCLVSLGVAVVYWGAEEGGKPNFLEILDPRMTKIEKMYGETHVFLKIDQAMKDAVRDPEGKYDPRNKLRYQSMPKTWIKQIEKYLADGERYPYLELQQDSYAVVWNRYTPFNFSANSFSGGPLQAAFDSLQRYRLIAAGDFAVAWNVKNMITLISEGDPKQDPKTYSPSDNLRLANLQSKFQSPDYSLTVYCDPTTEVRYVVPPIEVFDPKKYSQVEREIKEQLNLPSFMWNNDGGGTFGAATAEVKMFVEEIDWLRLAVTEQFFRPLYNLLRVRDKKPGFAKNAIVLPIFDKNSLKEDAIWLDAVKEGYGHGATSLGTYAEALGLDSDYEQQRLADEHEKYGSSVKDRTNPTTAQPLFEPQQGNQNPADEGGNPGKPGSPPKPARPRAPRKTGR